MLHSLVYMAMQAVAVAQAESGGAPGTGTGTGTGSTPTGLFGSFNPLILIIAMFAIMYFLMFRPQQKREKERREMLARLSKGDKVLTTGGIIGTIVGLNEKKVVLRVSEEPSVKMEFLRGAISRIISSELDEESGEDGK